MIPSDEELDVYDTIHEVLLETAPFFGVHPQIAGDQAKATIDRLRHRFGGNECYLAKHDPKRRDPEIFSKWKGNNLEELSQEYQLEPRHLRRIIERMQKMEKSSA